ncbi:hypothetical protein KKF34_05490 [Myxococcota bacterium]|nr:hypothetical protein [Myxococcota bacterium]MBU1379617.1 hypothetical protein [Myxococcota bacterium]MBU1496314.1 hypothetical protein [Myxococcota bacterium]
MLNRIIFITLTIMLFSCSSDDKDNNYQWNQDAGSDTTDVTDSGSDVTDAAEDADVIETNDPPPNVAGLWAYLNVRSSLVNYPMIGLVENDIKSYLLYNITQDGTTLNVEETACDIIIESTNTMVTTIIPDDFVDSMPIEMRTNELVKQGAGWAMHQPKYWVTQGVNLSDVENEELPAEPDDPRVFDQDGDGHPGLTVRLTGMLSGELYVVQRGWTILEPSVATEMRMEGLITWADQQVTLDADPASLKINPETNPNSNASRSYYIIVPVSAEMTCSELIEQAETLFPSSK